MVSNLSSFVPNSALSVPCFQSRPDTMPPVVPSYLCRVVMRVSAKRADNALTAYTLRLGVPFGDHLFRILNRLPSDICRMSQCPLYLSK